MLVRTPDAPSTRVVCPRCLRMQRLIVITANRATIPTVNHPDAESRASSVACRPSIFFLQLPLQLYVCLYAYLPSKNGSHPTVNLFPSASLQLYVCLYATYLPSKNGSHPQAAYFRPKQTATNRLFARSICKMRPFIELHGIAWVIYEQAYCVMHVPLLCPSMSICADFATSSTSSPTAVNTGSSVRFELEIAIIITGKLPKADVTCRLRSPVGSYDILLDLSSLTGERYPVSFQAFPAAPKPFVMPFLYVSPSFLIVALLSSATISLLHHVSLPERPMPSYNSFTAKEFARYK